MMKTLKEAEINVGSGLFTLFGCLSNAVGLTISASMLIVLGRKSLLANLPQPAIPLTHAQTNYLVSFIAQTHLGVLKIAGMGTDMLTKLNLIIHQSYKSAMSDVMLVLGTLAAIGVVMTLLMIKQQNTAITPNK